MASQIGYLLLLAGAVTFVVSLFGDSRKSMPLKFAATMMIVGGLAILQFTGTDAPSP